MKFLQDVKTVDDLQRVGENWYSRAKNLKDVADDEDRTPLERSKARHLETVMLVRTAAIGEQLLILNKMENERSSN